jgi:plasmid maintenance system antidote protein VapI
MNKKLETPGTFLKKVLDIYSISQEELIKFALISRKQLYNIINGNNLIPISIALYLKNTYKIPIIWWMLVNQAYCNVYNRKYIGIQTGHEMLLNAVLFEKDL